MARTLALVVTGSLMAASVVACGSSDGGGTLMGGNTPSDTAPAPSATTAPSASSTATPAPTSTGTATSPAPVSIVTATTTAPIVTDPLHGLKTGSDQLGVLCSRGSQDVFAKALCTGTAPSIGSVADLQAALGLSFGNKTATGFNGSGGNPAFALTTNSASLVLRSVSAANPRAIIMTPSSGWSPEQSFMLDKVHNTTPPPGWNPPKSTGAGNGNCNTDASQQSWSLPGDWRPPTSNGTLAAWPPGETPCTDKWWCTKTATNTAPTFPAAVADASFAVMAYSRGEAFAEVAAHDPSTSDINFYLVKFDAACQGGNCGPGDLSSPNAEKNWENVSIYSDADLTNTTLDCTNCHQAGGPGTPKTLLMREQTLPWTHWMTQFTAGGKDLLADFQSVHGSSEDYAGIPAALITKSEPRTLELMLHANAYLTTQNLTFASSSIEDQVLASSPQQPAVNTTPGASAVWEALFAGSVAGTSPIVPYHDVKITSSTKLASIASSYQQFLSGSVSASELPDITNLYDNSYAVDMGITPDASATGTQILTQTCTSCHNSSTDPSLTRARFDVTNLSKMSATELELAVNRMNLPEADVLHMPPARFHTLTLDQVHSAVAVLNGQ